MIDKIKNYTICILLVIISILLLMRSCNSTSKGSNKPILISHDTITTTKTIILKGKDTTIFKYIEIEKPVKEVKSSDTTGMYLTKTVNTFEDSLVDSNITIHTKELIRGDRLNGQLSYDLKVPKLVEVRITKIVKDSVKIYRPYCYDFSGGLRLGGNATTFGLAPYLSMRYKTTYFSTSYDLINKTYSVGLGIHLFSIK